MRNGIVAAVLVALTLSLTSATAHGSDPETATSAPTVDRQARWRVSGHWKGVRKDPWANRWRVKMRLKRGHGKRLHGRATYRHGGKVECRSRLRLRKRKKNGWIVFRERVRYGKGICLNGRTRIHRRPKHRLRVVWKYGIPLKDTGRLHRPHR